MSEVCSAWRSTEPMVKMRPAAIASCRRKQFLIMFSPWNNRFSATDYGFPNCPTTGQAATNRWSKMDSFSVDRFPERSIPGVGYANPRFPKLGIEVLRLSELLGRVPRSHFASPQRPGFHLLMLFTSGCGDHFL